jgi:N-acylneuraminate cytidylyltransferase
LKAGSRAIPRFFAVIPARAGSKRIPGKNIQPINGTPLIAYPIKAAVESELFEQVIISTDSQEIANLAGSYGAIAPFLRDESISDDFTPTIPVVRDAISRIGDIEDEDIICCLYPTSIFISSEILKNAVSKSLTLVADNFLVSYTSFSYPIQRALFKNKHGQLNFIHPENSGVRSQDLEPTFHDAAQFYFARKSAWVSQDSIFNNALGVEIPRKYVQDIDTPEDLEHAKLIFSILGKS